MIKIKEKSESYKVRLEIYKINYDKRMQIKIEE